MIVSPATNAITARYTNLNKVGIGSLRQTYATGAQISNVKAAKNAVNIGSPKTRSGPKAAEFLFRPQFCTLKLCADYSASPDMTRHLSNFLSSFREKMSIKCITGETNIPDHMREVLVILQHELHSSEQVRVSCL